VQYDVEVNGRIRPVTIERREGRFLATVDGRELIVDATLVGGHLLSLLIDRGATVDSIEISTATDPVTGGSVFGIDTLPVPAVLQSRRRFGRKDDGAAGGSGPQRLLAPMPGKIVRVLARPGDAVRLRQPIVVVEAMKMENELRAARDGVVVEMLVREGQSVDAGTLLAIVAPA
jgi:biotin carboxyl carrier protein